MLEYLRKLLMLDDLPPHGYCLLWQPELVWTHVVSDTLIGLAYFSIPVAIAYFLTKRRDVAFGWMVWMFAIFIMACGLTHFMSIWTLWNADYGVEALLKAVTALASVVTAVALWPLLPRAIALPSPAMLQLVNDDLRQRIVERDRALDALQRETLERQRTEELLRQSQKMEAVGQLTSGIAHDFNNILTVIIGNLDRATRQLDAGAPAAARVADALAGAERAAALTDQLLAFARKQPLRPERQDVNALIAQVKELAGPMIGPNIEIETRLLPNLWSVRTDANQTEAAILNLLVNARDAMPGGGRVTITTYNHVEDDGEFVGIEIRDSGEGMDKITVERAVDPFFTTKSVGRGTGLGLSQVHGFAAQSGGRLKIDSEPGQGTAVSIFLPRGA